MKKLVTKIAVAITNKITIAVRTGEITMIGCAAALRLGGSDRQYTGSRAQM